MGSLFAKHHDPTAPYDMLIVPEDVGDVTSVIGEGQDVTLSGHHKKLNVNPGEDGNIVLGTASNSGTGTVMEIGLLNLQGTQLQTLNY